MLNETKLRSLLNLGEEIEEFVWSNDDYSEIIFDPDTYPLDLAFEEVRFKIEDMLCFDGDEELDEDYCNRFMEYVESIIPLYEKIKGEI